MSTNSIIAMETKKGVKAIYCHWDGYLSNVGKTLFENYQNRNKVEKLISLGGISILGAEVETDLPHSFQNPAINVTVAYNRDRGEDDMPTLECSDIKEAMDYYRSAEYIYLFNLNDEWEYILSNYSSKSLKEAITCEN